MRSDKSRLPYRSIQIGLGEKISRQWAEEWIVSIEDVTGKALGLWDAVKEGRSREELLAMGLLMEEGVYEVSDELRGFLKMDEGMKIS